jgi:hypothetical protein
MSDISCLKIANYSREAPRQFGMAFLLHRDLILSDGFAAAAPAPPAFTTSGWTSAQTG